MGRALEGNVRPLSSGRVQARIGSKGIGTFDTEERAWREIGAFIVNVERKAITLDSGKTADLSASPHSRERNYSRGSSSRRAVRPTSGISRPRSRGGMFTSRRWTSIGETSARSRRPRSRTSFSRSANRSPRGRGSPFRPRRSVATSSTSRSPWLRRTGRPRGEPCRGDRVPQGRSRRDDQRGRSQAPRSCGPRARRLQEMADRGNPEGLIAMAAAARSASGSGSWGRSTWSICSSMTSARKRSSGTGER